MSTATLPVVVIGAGPVGMAAAAHLAERSQAFLVIEAGTEVAQQVRSWGHVQLFSPWEYCVDGAAVRLLSSQGWQMPDPSSYPNGHALIDQYLAPLAAHPAIAPSLRFGLRVTAITRAGIDKLSNRGRAEAPFVLHAVDTTGEEQQLFARAVIDASGTYATPNPMGSSGLPALGERALADQIRYGIPDVLDRERERYAGKRVLVVGSGHSAFNALLELIALAEQVPTTQITWAVRKDSEALARAYGGGSADALPARGELGMRLRSVVDQGVIELVTGWHTERVRRSSDGIIVSDGSRELSPVDQIIVTTGLRPDLQMLSELRLGLDPVVEAPTALAPLIDPNFHSCGSVPPHGVDQLSHPEPGFYMIGMKSYGRAPTFLLLTGYEQARSVVAALAGDWVAARDVQLVLPETGVCSGPLAAAGNLIAGGCCGADQSCGAPASQPGQPNKVDLGLISLTPVEASRSGCC
jgi:thioredoxin reductase